MATLYTLINIGSPWPWGLNNLAWAINNNGCVTGWTKDGGLNKAMRFKNSLEVLSPEYMGEGLGINNNPAEQIVGVVKSRYSENHAALWNDGEYVNLHTLFGYSPYIKSRAFDINDDGIVVGHAGLQAFSFDTNTQDLKILRSGDGDPIYATAINTSGKIVGAEWRHEPSTTLSPFLYDGNMHELPIPSGGSFLYYNTTIDINDSDNIVGTYHTLGLGKRAFAYSAANNHVEDIHNDAFAESGAHSINNNNVIVGYVESANRDEFAMIKYPAEELQKLIDLVVNPLHWELERATSINDKGEIVGYGKYYGQRRAFLLIPKPETPNSIDIGRGRLPTLVAQIIVGVIQGGDGIIWRPGTGPVPVDPEPYQQWNVLSSKEQEIIMSLAIQELAHLIGEKDAQRTIKSFGIKEIQWAVNDLLRKKP